MVRAEEAILKTVLEGDKQYLVPLYQRPYQWKPDQWQILWDDLEELVEDRRENGNLTHFIGSLVLVPVDRAQNAASVQRYLVVDGQQRLTTLTLLLAAIRDYKESNVADDAGGRIHDSHLTNPYERGDRRIKLKPTQQDRESYFNVIDRRRHHENQGLIGEAYLFFRSRLELFNDPKTVDEIESAVLVGLTVVSISTHPEDNVHRIFQSLNNTGLKLTQGDLIRNIIFMGLPSRAEVVYQNHWLPMQSTLPDNQALEQLFWLDLLATKPTLKVNDTFSQYQKHLSQFSSEVEVENEVARLADLARQYSLILSPEKERDEEVRFRLKRLRTWNVATPHSLVLELLRRREEGSVSDTTLARSLHLIESYLVRRLLIDKNTKNLNRIFPQILHQLNSKEPLDFQIHRLLSTGQRHFATDEQIRLAIEVVPFYLSGRRQHRVTVLRWLEESFGSKEPVNTTKLSIEHVMPQTLSLTWREQLSAIHGASQVDDIHSATVHTLGNLTLTGYNAEMSNRPFESKKLEFIKSGLRLNQFIAEFESWGSDEIKQRARHLANQIIATWPGPLTDDTDHQELPTTERKLRLAVGTIPPGRWAGLADVAAVAGTDPESVKKYLSNQTIFNAHKVFGSDGKIIPSLSPLDPQQTQIIKEALAQEGIQLSAAGTADPSARVNLEQLLRLVEMDDASEVLLSQSSIDTVRDGA